MPSITRPMFKRGEPTSTYRIAMGKWIKELRLAAGLTQKQLAQRVDMGWNTGVSAIELGRSPVPPDRLLAFADALEQDPRIFAAKVLSYTYPHAYALLLGADPRAAFARVLEEIPERISGIKRDEEERACQ